MFEIFEKLKNAYGASTHSTNHFEKALKSIKWDSEFYADGEHYFTLGGFTFTTPSLNPFDMEWKPSAIFADGSYLEF